MNHEGEENMALDTLAILDWMEHPLAVLDQNFVLVWCNRAFSRLGCGPDCKPEDLIGRSALEDDDPQRRGLLQQALQDRVHRFSRMSIFPGSPVQDLEVRSGVVSVGGKDRYMVLSAEPAAPSGDALVTDAQIAAAGRLAAGIAHEFNNLHAGILGFLEQMLTRSDLDEELREDLETIRELARRASAITRNLMAFGLRRVSIMGAVSPNVLVASAVDHMKPALENIGVSVQEQNSGQVPGLYVDRDQIVQVLENLLQNAVDAMVGMDRKELRIIISQDEHFVTIEVADSGRGIPDEQKQRVFEPFFTTKGSASASRGLDAALDGVGLGLSVCKSIVEQHGGKIEFSSEVDRGSRFMISLPKLPAFGEETESEAHEGDQPPAAMPRLLVVDDEDSVRRLIARVGESEGWQVATADDALRALDMIEHEQFDTVVLDLRMPGMDGMEMLRHLEKIPEGKRPAVVVCSGAPSDVVLDSRLVVGILTKPFELRDLVDVLHRSLSH